MGPKGMPAYPVDDFDEKCLVGIQAKRAGDWVSAGLKGSWKQEGGTRSDNVKGSRWRMRNSTP